MSRAGFALTAAAGLLAAGLAACAGPLLHRHLSFFPRLQRGIEAFARQREAPGPAGGPHQDLRVILHVHTRASFDSQGSEESVAQAASAAGARAVFLSEHPPADAAVEIPAARLAAEKMGVRLVPGIESRPGVALWSPRPLSLAARPGWEDLRGAASAGALLFLTHPRGEFQAHADILTGVEVYNAHDDVGDEDPWRSAPQVLLSRRKFPALVAWWLTDEPRERLRLWDRLLSRGRRLAGVAGNDAHEGLGIELHAAADGDLRVNTSGGLPVGRVSLGTRLTRLLRRLRGAEEDTAAERARGLLYRAVVDPYDVSFRVVSTHLLARCPETECLLEALRAGRAYLSFDILGDPTGFRFEARARGGVVPVGGALPASDGIRIEVESPLPARLRLLRDGALAEEALGRGLRHPVDGPGAYRVEATLALAGRNDLPWVFTSPIFVEGGPGAGGALARKAEHVRRALEARHRPEGLVLNAYLDPEGRPIRYQDFGDQAIWSGIYAMACAHRARVTRRPEDLRELERAAAALHALHAVTGGGGALARGMRGPAAPGEAEGLRWFPGGPGYETHRWAGDVSKDQLIGFVFGSAAVHEAALDLGEPSLERAARALGGDLAAILRRLRDGGWILRDPDGRPSRHGDLRAGPPGLRVNGLNALIALATARAAASLSGEADLERLYRDDLVGRRDYPSLARRWLRIDFGPFTRFDNFNMAFLSLYALLGLEPDEDLRRLYASTLRERLWEGRISGHHNAFFTYIAASARARGPGGGWSLEDARALAQALEALREYPWSLRDRRVEPPSALARAWFGDRKGRARAREPAPIRLRPPGAFLWKEDPRRIEGGAAEGREFPGVDYLAAYWLGRSEGLIPERE